MILRRKVKDATSIGEVRVFPEEHLWPAFRPRARCNEYLENLIQILKMQNSVHLYEPIDRIHIESH